jgi:hypothetical protein
MSDERMGKMRNGRTSKATHITVPL